MPAKFENEISACDPDGWNAASASDGARQEAPAASGSVRVTVIGIQGARD